MLCTDKCWKKSFYIDWKNASFVFNNNKKRSPSNDRIWSHLKAPNSNCFIPFAIILNRILSRNYISNDPFLYFNIHVALYVDFSFPLFIMLLELMPRRHTLSRSLFFFLDYYYFSFVDLIRSAEVHETSSLF